MQADDNPSVRAPRLPEGQRIYAVGPVQGQIGLLRRLLLQIYGDSRIRKPASTSIVFLGDLTGPEPLSIDLTIALSRIASERCVVLRCLEDDIFCANLIDSSTRWKSGDTEADMEAQIRLHDQPHGENTVCYDEPKPNIAAVNDGEKAPLSWSAGDYIFLPRDARMPDGNVITGDHFPIKHLPGDDPLLIHARPSRAQLSVRRQFSLGSERIAICNAAGQYGNLVALAIDGDEMLLMRTISESNALVDFNSLSDSDSPLEASAHNSIDEIDRLIRAIIGSSAPDSLENMVKSEQAPRATRTRSEDISNPTRRIARPSTRTRSIVLVLLIPLSAVVLMRPSVPDHVHRDLHSLPIEAIALPLKRSDSVALPRAPLPPLLASDTQDRTAERSQSEGHTKIKRNSRRPTAVLWSKTSQRERHSPYLQRPLITSQGTGQAVHLTGKALEIALAADRLATRNLNNLELDNIRAASGCRRTKRRGQNACVRSPL